ncbi:hypothetical protein TTHT_2230 [Thermotomaculum hydrothermale]|uniref:Uncharacterized protein n=1 Tax=Thermotomaculum hydrothermale TaxID=981385 RepID=A0A7R6PJE2_9BACT|nr:hypothetical protein [Thermotomaculum hydrothermale]BBB33654.1 hypothetical protein TTHT_2230 [Thermotomaculum hydrothermale]
MKKSILIALLIILPLTILGDDLKNNPFVQEFIPKVKTKVSLKVYRIKTKRECAHPQTLTPKQANKILHSIKIKRQIPLLVLNNEEIMKILKDFVKNMAEAGKNEMVVIEKQKNI